MDEDRDYEQIVTEFVRYNLDPAKLQFTITLKPEDKPIGKIYLSRINRTDDSLDVYKRQSIPWTGQAYRLSSCRPPAPPTPDSAWTTW